MISPADFVLRPLIPSDRERLLGWRNSERVRVNMYTDHVITEEEHAAWFARVVADPSCDYRVCEHRGRPIGLVALTNIDTRSSRATWAFYLGEADAPRGSGAAMEFLALEHAFGERRLRKLCCEVLSFNTRVIRMHKRFGFQQEGLLARHVVKNGKYEDVVLLAMFASDWPQKRAELEAKIWSTGAEGEEP